MQRRDLLVVGAGPAGAEAAITARRLGLTVIVLDEAEDAGGQIYRKGNSKGTLEGNALRDRLRACGAELAFEHRVWSAARTETGFEVAAIGPEKPMVVAASSLVVASGAIERFYPRPGWTLPGVIGLGAATVMIKAHHILPGRRVLVAGAGPLAPLVANLILEHGGEVVALADPNTRSSWLRALPGLASRPDLMLQSGRWMARLLARRVPILHGWDIRRIDGGEHGESVTIGRVDESWRPLNSSHDRQFAVDAVCFGYGLFPATEFYRQLGAGLEYDPARGGWIPRLDAGLRTTIPGLYAAGDGATLAGVAAASFTGTIAAVSAAFDLARLDRTSYEHARATARTGLARAIRFTDEIGRMMQPRASAMQAVADETIVCRCEDISAGELREAVRSGACEINALKAATRCGMGPCGGRMCGEAAAALMECSGVPRKSIGYWTARPPLRPVPIEALTGEYEYSDIPIKESAPL